MPSAQSAPSFFEAPLPLSNVSSCFRSCEWPGIPSSLQGQCNSATVLLLEVGNIHMFPHLPFGMQGCIPLELGDLLEGICMAAMAAAGEDCLRWRYSPI